MTSAAPSRATSSQERRDTTRLRIVVADDHPVVRAGLEAMLETQPDFELVGSAGTGSEALQCIQELLPNVALVDLRMPESDGNDVIRHVRHAGLSTRVIMLTTYGGDANVARAFECGASAYLLKDTPSDELFETIRRVARGQSVIAPARAIPSSATPGSHFALSAREIEVLTWLARGETNRGIARHLCISEATVKTHLIHIFSKLGQSHRTAVVAEALRQGLICLDEFSASSPAKPRT